MEWLFLYLAVGVINALWFAWRERFSSLPEVAFFVLAWPLQALFWLLIGVHNGIEWLYLKLAGEK